MGTKAREPSGMGQRRTGSDSGAGRVEGMGLLVVGALAILMVGGLAMYLFSPNAKVDPPVEPPPIPKMEPSPTPLLESGSATDTRSVSRTVEGRSNDCWSVRTKVPSVIPLSLAHAYKKNDHLYWMQVDLENGCERELQLTISRHPPIPLSEDSSEPLIKYTVKKHDSISVPLPKGGRTSQEWDATIKLLKRDADSFEPIKLDVSVEDTFTGKVLKKITTKEIRLLPRTTVYWDSELPKRLILASLGAWVQKQPVRDEAKTLLDSLEPEPVFERFAAKWFDGLCSHYLQGADAPLILRPPASGWRIPPSGEQTIRTSETLLTLLEDAGPARGVWVDGIEATLFLAALTKHTYDFKQLRTAMFARLSDENGVKTPEFFIAWTADGSSWSALNVSRAREQSCEENRQASSRWLNHLLAEREDYRRDLALGQGIWTPSSKTGHGVILDEEAGIAAVDFHVSRPAYQISGLP